MKIRLLSDLHLETGPFTYQDCGEDVVVLAGDIGNGVAGIEWAKTIPKPVVYVSGNHEHWTFDIYENLDAMRSAAKGSNVRFLENNEVFITINGETVRFVGATLWTDFGRRHCELHPRPVTTDFLPHEALMAVANSFMRDYQQIRASRWWENKRRVARYTKFEEGRLREIYEKRLLVPRTVADMHAKSRAWLTEKLKERPGCRTIVVSHHAPSYQSLLEAGMIESYALEQDIWRNSMDDRHNLVRVAGYASDAEELVADADIWLHGHTHERISYPLNGALVACNPRGYFDPPMTRESADNRTFWLGISISDERIAEDQRDFEERPERGDVYKFERSLIIDTETSLPPLVIDRARALLPGIQDVIDDVERHLPYLRRRDQTLRHMAGGHIARRCAEYNTRLEELLQMLGKSSMGNVYRESKYLSLEMSDLGFCNDAEARKGHFSVNKNFSWISPLAILRAEEPGIPQDQPDVIKSQVAWGRRNLREMRRTFKRLDERLDERVQTLCGKRNRLRKAGHR